MLVWKTVMYGGYPVLANKAVLATNQPHILVGTASRIKDMVRQKVLNVNTVKYSVLEA